MQEADYQVDYQKVVVYGFPDHIHRDHGASFEREVLSELLELSDVAKSHSTAYHPMGNGGKEQFN